MIRAATLALCLGTLSATANAAPDPLPLVPKIVTEPGGVPQHMVASRTHLYWSEERSEARRTPGLYAIAFADPTKMEDIVVGDNVDGVTLAGEDLVFAVGGTRRGKVFVLPSGTTEARMVMSGAKAGFDVEALVGSGSDIFASLTPTQCTQREGLLVRGSSVEGVDPVPMADACPEEIAVGNDRVVWVEYRGNEAPGGRHALMSLPRNATRESSTPTELGAWTIYDAPVIFEGRVYFVVDQDLLSLPIGGGKPTVVAKDFRRKLYVGRGMLLGVELFGGNVATYSKGAFVPLVKLGVEPYTLFRTLAFGPEQGLYFGVADMQRGGVLGEAVKPDAATK